MQSALLFLAFSSGALAGAVPLLIRGLALRRRLEATCRELIAVFETTACGAVVTDAGLTVLHANHAFENLAGRARSEIEGKMKLDAFLATESALELRENHQLLQTHPSAAKWRYQIRLIDKTGGLRHALASEARIPGSRRCVTSFQDVSAAKLNEWAARESNSKYQSIFENIAVGIFQTSADGRYLSANRALARIYGYEDGQDLMGNLTDISRQLYVDPNQRDRFKTAMEEKEEIFDFESEVYRRDGSTVWIRENARVVRDVGGAFLYYEGIVEDITRRRIFEEELRIQNRRLEQAFAELKAAQSKLVEQERLHALGQMASGIAHDFNNSLSPILGYADLLLKRKDLWKDTERLERYIGMIHTSAKDAANVVNKLRNLYRRRPQAETMEPLDLAALVRQCIDLTQPRWKNQALAMGAQIEFETRLAPAQSIYGDQTELREALTNLIFNAVDAMPKGGTIKVDLRREGEGLLLTFEDSGKGMSPEVRVRCFEPFFTTKGEHGTGLGLAMVYTVVKRHEGAIEIESEPEQFTRFRIRLPLKPRRLSRGEESVAIPLRTPGRVLAMDDEPAMLGIIKDLLEADGTSVVAAADAIKALDLFAEGTFDLVILDQGMPGISGETLAARIRNIAPSQAILMLTGFGDMMIARGEAPLDVDYVVSKPVTRDALRKGIAHAMHISQQACGARPAEPPKDEAGLPDCVITPEAAVQAALDSMLATCEHLEERAERPAEPVGQRVERTP